MIKKIIIFVLCIYVTLGLSGCMGNSGNLTEGLTNATNTFNYVLTHEAGVFHLHKVDKWKDSNSDALGISTTCCNNQFWTSYNSAILYTTKPTYLPENVTICGK